MAQAEAATRKFRKSLEDLSDPFKSMPREFPMPRVPKERLPREGEDAAGAFARGFSKRLDTAFRALPMAQITATSTDAEAKVQTLRTALRELSAKTIGVDIRADRALGELEAIRHELATIDASADIDLRADTSSALAEIRAVQAEVDRFNTDAAARELDDLRSRLDALRGRTIGVDLDAGAARAELAELQRQLESLNRSTANPDVRVDSARALADLRAVQAELASTGGRSALPRVDADVSGALAKIALVGAALASLPAVTSIAVGVGALGAAFGAAGVGAAAFGAVAIPALGRVNEALQQQESAAGGAGGAVESLAQKQAKAAASALSLAQAQDRVKDAHDAVKQAQEQVGLTADRVAEQQASAARRIEDAERSVAESHRATQRAVEDLTRAREQAQQRLEDLALASEGGALAEERARISLARAKSELEKLQANPNSGALDKEDAALRVKEAEFALKSVKARNEQMAKEQAKGVEGSDEVRRAKDAIASAAEREQRAERDLEDARTAASKAAVEGQREIAKSQQAVIKAQRDALRAAQALHVQQMQAKAAMEKTGGAAGGAASKFAELTKEEQKLANKIKGFKKDYEDWQRSLEGDVFPAISGGLDLISSQLPRISPLVRTAGRSFLGLEKDAQRALQAPFWDEFLTNVDTAMPRAIEGLGHTIGNTFEGAAGVLDALLPHADGVVTSLEKASKRFADWGTTLRDNPNFKAFVAYAAENGPKVGEIIGNIAEAVGKIAQAGGKIGPEALDLLVGISEKIANLSPDQIQAVATGVGLIFAAVKLGQTLKIAALLGLAEVITRLPPPALYAIAGGITAIVLATKGTQAISTAVDLWGSFKGKLDGVSTSASTAKGKLAGLGQGLGALGGVTAVTASLGAVDQHLNGFKQNLPGVTKDLETFARTGKLTGSLASTWGDSLSDTVVSVDSWGEAIGTAGDTSESFRQAISRLANPGPLESFKTNYLGVLSALTFGTRDFDDSAQQIAGMDQALAAMVTSGKPDEAAQAFQRFAGEAAKMGVPLDKVKAAFPEYTAAVSAAKGPTDDAAAAIGGAKSKLDDFQATLDVFTGRTDVEAALAGLKQKYDDVKSAVDAAGGKLDFSARMTDKQRDAVVTAREKFAGYISDVKTIADKQADLAKATGDSAVAQDKQKLAILQAAPKMFELAGKSKEAREAIFKLGESAGISRTQLSNAKDEVAKLRLEISRLQNKTITITATVKGDGSRSTGAGKALHADGAVVDYYAAGGIREAHVAQIAPAGTIRVWNEPETAGEAYIPLAASKRARSLAILREVADRFDQVVIPLDAATSAATAASSGSGTRAVSKAAATKAAKTSSTSTSSSTSSTGGTDTVTVIDLDKVALEAGYAARAVGTAAAATSDAATATVDAADQLGSTMEGALSTLGGQITTLGSQIGRLSTSVDSLATSVSAAAAAGAAKAAASGSSSSSKSSTSKSNTSKTGTKTASGSLQQASKPPAAAVSAAKAAAQAAAKQDLKKLVHPYADGGLVTDPVILAGEAGREVVVPIDRRGRGRETLHQAASMLGYHLTPGLSGPRYSGTGGAGFGQELRDLRQAISKLADAKPGNTNTFNITNNNPVAEKTSTTTNRVLQYVSNAGL